MDGSGEPQVSKQIVIGEMARPAGALGIIIKKQRIFENCESSKLEDYIIFKSNNCSTDQMNCNLQLGPGGEID